MEGVVALLLIIFSIIFSKKKNKAIRLCKTCENSISVEAKVCPHCGQPDPVKATSGCFVATAVFGDYDHPIVKDFRYFRDNYLNKYSSGKQFIKIYYTYGPILARLAYKNILIANLLRYLILKPIHFIIKKLN